MPKDHLKQHTFLVHWIICHIRALLFSLGGLVRTPFASLMTLAVVGITMALPASLFVLLQNFQALGNHLNGTPTISLYLKLDVSTKQATRLTQQLKSQNQIAAVHYISPAQGLREFIHGNAFASTLENFKVNPLPGVIVITPQQQQRNPEQMQTLLQQLKQLPQVGKARLDLNWVKRFYSIIMLGQRITYILAILFGMGILLIIGNTIRLTLQQYQQEIGVLKLIGATHAFIRRPLIYRGLLLGLFGGLFAWLLVALVFWWLQAPADQLAASYNNQLQLSGMNIHFGGLLVAIGVVLGFLGTFIAVNHHLKAREQT